VRFFQNQFFTEPPATQRFWHKWTSFTLLWIPGFTLLITFAFSPSDSFEEFIEDYLISTFIGEIVMTICLTGSYIISYTEAFILELCSREYQERATAIHVLRSMLFALPGMYVAFHITDIACDWVGFEFTVPSMGGYKRGMIISLLSITFYIAFDLYNQNRRQNMKLASIERESLKSKISALAAQMNPHLLFNALNSVAATIKENPDAAEEMTVELAVLYRRILAASKTDRHTLGNEIEICRSYLQVEKSRFGDRIAFSIEVSQGLADVVIPSLIMQPIVENAVKHGISPLSKRSSLSIKAERLGQDLKITVENNGVGYGQSPEQGSTTALANCQSRLSLIYGNQASLDISILPQTSKIFCSDSRGCQVTISMPVFIEI
jgi:hypothetical protein